MVEGKVWEKKKITIVFVVVIAVCAISATVVALVLNKDRFFGQEDRKGTFPGSVHTEEFNEINQLVAGMPEEDAKKLYEEVIATASTAETEAEARVEYGGYLLDNGDISLFAEQFEQVDEEILDDGYKILYYATLVEYYTMADDNEAGDEYREKMKVVIKNSDYAAGG